MIVEFGHFALILALLVTLVQRVVPAWGAYRNDVRHGGVGAGVRWGWG